TSADGGDSWDAVPTDTDTGLPERALGGFGWYFGQLRVHPFNENQIYLLGVELWEYDNQMWRQTTPNWSNYIVHADKHDLVFTTNNQMLLATDGGLYRSTDFGTSWQDIENISATQFYRVAYNPHRPDLYYGGAQDNGTTGGNREDNINWTRIFGGDGFQTVFHPLDPDVFYLEIQNGRIYVTSNNGEDYEFAMNGIDAMDRRNWDMPYLMNPLNADELFAGTYRVYRSRSGVIPAWEAVSEDLTDGIADRYHTISAMHASPLADGQLIVGTSDANVWLTTDHGDRWQRLDNEQLPNRYVSDVKLSPTETARLYVSYSGYKDGDNRPHIYRSDDAGQQWFSIAGNLPNIAINDIFVLPQQSDSVIFVGTDAGVYATLDGGTDWQRLGNNMPIIPIYDMTWNEARHQLVVGSHARGIYTYPLDSLLQDVVSSYVFSSEKPVVAAPLDIYPNPAQATVNIEFLNHEIGKSAQLLVFSAAGQLVHRQEIGAATNTTRKHLRLDVNNWTPGTYHVHLKIRHQILSGQFLVVQ
ncbi:MAG: T9SS type A sorting domain-containing protein, partial [Bacteroidota bacterium]